MDKKTILKVVETEPIIESEEFEGVSIEDKYTTEWTKTVNLSSELIRDMIRNEVITLIKSDKKLRWRLLTPFLKGVAITALGLSFIALIASLIVTVWVLVIPFGVAILFSYYFFKQIDKWGK